MRMTETPAGAGLVLGGLRAGGACPLYHERFRRSHGPEERIAWAATGFFLSRRQEGRIRASARARSVWSGAPRRPEILSWRGCQWVFRIRIRFDLDWTSSLV